MAKDGVKKQATDAKEFLDIAHDNNKRLDHILEVSDQILAVGHDINDKLDDQGETIAKIQDTTDEIEYNVANSEADLKKIDSATYSIGSAIFHTLTFGFFKPKPSDGHHQAEYLAQKAAREAEEKEREKASKKPKAEDESSKKKKLKDKIGSKSKKTATSTTLASSDDDSTFHDDTPDLGFIPPEHQAEAKVAIQQTADGIDKLDDVTKLILHEAKVMTPKLDQQNAALDSLKEQTTRRSERIAKMNDKADKMLGNTTKPAATKKPAAKAKSPSR